MAFERMPDTASEASGRGSPDHPRFMATKSEAKSAGILSQIARTTSGVLLQRRFNPHSCVPRPTSGEKNKRLAFDWLCPHSRSRPAPCARRAVRLLSSYTEFSHSIPEVSEWRCHRHEYRADQ